MLEHLLRPLTRLHHHEINRTKNRGFRGRVRRGSMHQEDWLEIRRHYDFLQKDQIKATVIRITLIFVVPLSYFLVPLDENRTRTHELVTQAHRSQLSLQPPP